MVFVFNAAQPAWTRQAAKTNSGSHSEASSPRHPDSLSLSHLAEMELLETTALSLCSSEHTDPRPDNAAPPMSDLIEAAEDLPESDDVLTTRFFDGGLASAGR